MGILDDAIREHLELKRKHGVPEEDVERQQEEALGPARREVAQQPDDAEIAADEASPAAASEGGAQPGAPAAEVPAAAEQPAAADETAAVEDTAVPEAPAAAKATAVPEPPAVEHEPAPAEPPAAEPPTAAEPPVADHTGMEPPVEHAPAGDPKHEPDPHEKLGDTEPHGFPAVEDDEEQEDVEDLAASEPEEDVLEDTPDFLQETPEHDRLWFEQKPPRDFDFD